MKKMNKTMKEPVLLYASPEEVKYINYKPRFCIGVGATRLDLMWPDANVILFGCSGMLRRNHRLLGLLNVGIVHWLPHIFYPQIFGGLPIVQSVHVNESIKRKDQVEEGLSLYSNANLVDMESGMVCEKFDFPPLIIRYAIDLCHKKMFPFPVNHFWRKWQHRKRQMEMDSFLKNYNQWR